MKFSVNSQPPFFLIAQVAGGLFGGGEGGGGREGWLPASLRLRCSFAHSANKNARFANYFLLLILETPSEGKTPYKWNKQAWPVFIKF